MSCIASNIRDSCLQEISCLGKITSELCPGSREIKCCSKKLSSSWPSNDRIPESVNRGRSKSEVPQPGVELIKRLEGLELEAYTDPLSGNLVMDQRGSEMAGRGGNLEIESLLLKQKIF